MAKAVKVTGLKELELSLQQFTKATQRRVLERALLKAAQPIEAAAKRNAPVLTGKLKASISTKVVRTNAGKVAYAEAMQAGLGKADAAKAARAANQKAAGTGKSALVRVAAAAPHAIFAEFGTQHSSAHPFLGPALRANGKQAMLQVRAELASEIEKTAQRVAKRKTKQ